MAQQTVSLLQPIGTPGQRVNLNPLNVVAAPNGGFRAGANGLAVGFFAWADPSDTSGRTLINSGSGSPLGFLHKNRTGVIVEWLARSVDGILPGQETVIYNGGDFAALVGGKVPVTSGTQVYADPKTGAVCASTSKGAVPTNFTFTSGGNVGDLVSISGYVTTAILPPSSAPAPAAATSAPAATSNVSSTTSGAPETNTSNGKGS